MSCHHLLKEDRIHICNTRRVQNTKVGNWSFRRLTLIFGCVIYRCVSLSKNNSDETKVTETLGCLSVCLSASQ